MRFLIILILAINTIFSSANAHNDSNTNSTIIDEHHTHEAPHGGILIELGDHFGLMELLHDPNKGSLQAWFLDGCGDNYVRLVKQKIKFVVHGRFLNKSVKETVSFELSPKANPLTGETRQSTSQYQLIHDQLKGVARLKGMILNVKYKGNNFKNLTFDTKPLD